MTGQRALLTPHCLPREKDGQRLRLPKRLVFCQILQKYIFQSFHPLKFCPCRFIYRSVISIPISSQKLCRKTHQLTLSAATGAASVPTHGDGLSLLGDVVEEGKGTLQLHAVDSLSSLTGVLEADTEVRAPSAGALSGRNVLSSVTDLMATRKIQQSARPFIQSLIYHSIIFFCSPLFSKHIIPYKICISVDGSSS